MKKLLIPLLLLTAGVSTLQGCNFPDPDAPSTGPYYEVRLHSNGRFVVIGRFKKADCKLLIDGDTIIEVSADTLKPIKP